MPAPAPKRTCANGHQYYKSSNCSACPVCERERKPANNFLSYLSAPAKRALQNNNITTLQPLSFYTKKEVLSFHGMGKSSIPKLQQALAAGGLSFKQ